VRVLTSRACEPRRMRVVLAALLLAAAVIGGCGDSTGEPGPPAATPGTAVVFDLDADVADPAHFYDLPYPADLRRDATGRIVVTGVPSAERSTVIVSVIAAAGEQSAFSTTQTAYFRFGAPLAPRSPADVIPAGPDAPVLLVDVDPRSPSRGRLVPTVASTLPTDAYAPPNLLAVAPAPGNVLEPDRTYAIVVRRTVADAGGAPLGVPLAVAQLAAGVQPGGRHGEAMASMLEPAWQTLERLGVDRQTVAALTTFTTGDVVRDVERLSTAIVDRYDGTIEDLALDPVDGAVHERFCELHGTIQLPQFQTGRPPFNRDGVFALDSDGVPIAQRTERVPIVVTVPRQSMPAGGFPLVMYAHGSGGLAAQGVDRGRVAVPGGTAESGKGPAHVLAAHGFATVASALPLNPERLPGADPRAYLNLRNLRAYPYTFQQGTIELRLLLEALERLAIDPATLATCDGLRLPEGEPAVRVRTDRVFAMGQSMGAQYVTMLGAVEPKIVAITPTGSGGLWSLVILEADGATSGALIAVMLGTEVTLDFLHPGLQLVQTAFEAAEPLVYAPRVGRRPLPAHPARDIFEPVGLDDPGFPDAIYNAMALAYGNQQAGDVLRPGLQAALALGELAGPIGLPARDNVRRAGTAEPRTGVVVQYAGDGVLDGHHVFSQLDAVKYQYGCFFRTAWELGVGVVPPALPLGTPCPD